MYPRILTNAQWRQFFNLLRQVVEAETEDAGKAEAVFEASCEHGAEEALTQFYDLKQPTEEPR